MKKKYFIVLVVIFLSFLAGSVTSKQLTSAAECSKADLLSDEPNCDLNHAYMGGKWQGSLVNITLGQIDNATLKKHVNGALDHFESQQSHLDFIRRNDPYPIARGNILVTDDYYGVEKFYARVTNSWYGGWPINVIYDNSAQMNMQFNLSNYFNGTEFNHIGTARHELGHAIGMGHRNSTNALLYCFRSRTVNYLTASDKEIIEVIY